MGVDGRRRPPGGRGVASGVRGEVTVEGCPLPLTPAELELLVLLAVRAAVMGSTSIGWPRCWPGKPGEHRRCGRFKLGCVVSHKLGRGADGDFLIPHTTRGPNSPARYRLHPAVVTDLDLIDAALNEVDALHPYDVLGRLCGAVAAGSGGAIHRPGATPGRWTLASDRSESSPCPARVSPPAATLGDPAAARLALEAGDRGPRQSTGPNRVSAAGRRPWPSHTATLA